MRDWARLQSAIEIIDQVLAGQGPVDRLLKDFGRNNRFAGSKDRRAIADLVYRGLKDGHALLTATELPVTGRSILLADCLNQGQDPQTLFADLTHGPANLSDKELRKISSLSGGLNLKDHIPDWVRSAFEDRFGGDAEEAAEALQGRATVDLRVNSLKANPEAIADEVDVPTAAINGLAMGLRLDRAGTNLTNLPAFKNGMFEIQDAAGQLAVQWSGFRPGQQVLDLCAGAGGKTLAIAAEMQNQGRLLAYDIEAGRMDPLKRRAKRAEADVIEIMTDKEALDPLHSQMDRVVLDVPCSGSGTWRRHPELKWHWSAERLSEVQQVQEGLLDQGADCVKPGGVLCYYTCSVFPSENEDQISRFLADHKDFQLIPVDGGCYHNDLAKIPGTVQLAPHISETDGFFIALMERVK